jgi:CRP-like cAMP-binding protein
MDTAKIRTRYLRSINFWIDLLAVIPFNMVNLLPGATRAEIWNVNKLLRLFKLSSQIERLEHQFYTMSIQIRLFKLVFYTYLLSHFIGCTWFHFASNASQIFREDVPEHFGLDGWLPAANMCLNVTANPRCNEMSLMMKYAKAHYWGLGMLLGFHPGGFPEETYENLFTIAVQTLGVFLLAYVVGHLLDIVQVMDGNNRLFYSNLTYVRQLLGYFQFSPEMEAKIGHFYFYRLFHSIHEEHILATCLPPSLTNDIRLFLLTPMLNKVRFFQDDTCGDVNIRRVLVSQMTQMLITRGEAVCRQGEIGVEMYFIFSGCLEVYIHRPTSRRALFQTTSSPSLSTKEITDKMATKGVKVNELEAGAFFGERSLFSDKPRNATIEAKTFCTLYKLSRKHLESVFGQHPAWKEKVMQSVKVLYAEQEEKMKRDQEKSEKQLKTDQATAALARQQQHDATSNHQRSNRMLLPVTAVRKRLASMQDTFRWKHVWMTCCQWRQFCRMVFYVEVQSPVYRSYLILLRLCLTYIAISIPVNMTLNHGGLSAHMSIVIEVISV